MVVTSEVLVSSSSSDQCSVKARVNGKVLKSQFKNRQTKSLIRTAYSSKFWWNDIVDHFNTVL